MNIIARSLIVLSFLCGSVLAATTVGNPEPASGTWRVYRGSGFTTFVCQAASEEDAKACAARDAQTRATTTRYQIRYPNRYLTVTYSADAPPPPPSTAWTQCAIQEQICSFVGTRRVRYGVDTRWVERDFTDGVLCNSTTFGTNPAPNVGKSCQLQGTNTPPPPPPPPPTGTGVVTLRWTPPTLNEDGTQLTNLAGHRAYCTQGGAVRMTEVMASSTTATVDRLATGPWICYATAFNSNGVESAPSNNVTKVIP